MVSRSSPRCRCRFRRVPALTRARVRGAEVAILGASSMLIQNLWSSAIKITVWRLKGDYGVSLTARKRTLPRNALARGGGLSQQGRPMFALGASRGRRRNGAAIGCRGVGRPPALRWPIGVAASSAST